MDTNERAWVVFIRAANVGGHQTFQPRKLAEELAGLGVTSVGAAGTFVVRKAKTEDKVRAAFLSRLPFKPELMICPAAELLALVREEPLGDPPPAEDARPFCSVLARLPAAVPDLPYDRPGEGSWEVRIAKVRGRLVLCWRRAAGPKGLYPNEVVEKLFERPSTTRGWNTIQTVCAKLDGRGCGRTPP